MAYNRKTGLYEGWIYKITSDVTPYVYIGQTRQKNADYRWTEHKIYAKNFDLSIKPSNDKPYLYRDMKQYGIDHFNMEVVEFVEFEKENDVINKLNELETKYISEYDSFINGYNKTSGGAGATGFGKPCDAYDKEGNFIFTMHTVAEMSAYTGVTSMAIIKCCNGQNVPRSNYVFRWRGDSFDKYRTVVNHRNNRTIYCYTKDGKFVGKYNSLSEVANELGIYYNSANQALRRNSISHGYYFNTVKSFDYVEAQGSRKPVDVYKYDTKEFVGSYKSIRDAMDDLGIEKMNKSIVECMEGRHNQACGYIWRHPGDAVDKFRHVNSRINMMKPINVYDLDDNFITTYPSAAFAGNELNLDRNRIGMYARKVNFASCGDYKFYFANDETQPDKSKVTDMTPQEIVDKYDYVI